MTKQNTLGTRLSDLQSEAKDLIAQRHRRPAKKKGNPKSTKPVSEPAEPDSLHLQLEEMAHAFETRVEDFANEAKDGFREHPILTVAAAFAIGILIGRLSK